MKRYIHLVCLFAVMQAVGTVKSMHRSATQAGGLDRSQLGDTHRSKNPRLDISAERDSKFFIGNLDAREQTLSPEARPMIITPSKEPVVILAEISKGSPLAMRNLLIELSSKKMIASAFLKEVIKPLEDRLYLLIKAYNEHHQTLVITLKELSTEVSPASIDRCKKFLFGCVINNQETQQILTFLNEQLVALYQHGYFTEDRELTTLCKYVLYAQKFLAIFETSGLCKIYRSMIEQFKVTVDGLYPEFRGDLSLFEKSLECFNQRCADELKEMC